MNRIMQFPYRPITDKYRDEQIAHMANWEVIPDADETMAALHVIHMYPMNGTTETVVNPTDPGDGWRLHRSVPVDPNKTYKLVG